ncbi:hypothetical protein AB0K35_27740 [Micromonospora sp. NPDC053740]|uniref:hypothetical protein n=1 Tax=Micromonospora sp. NPDC053740 TaxID=3155173 RepID=UPI0034307AF7
MSFFDRIRPGHAGRNDGPAFHDLKPQPVTADYGTHPLWCHNTGHDGPCQTSTAATDPDGVRFKVTVVYNPISKDPQPQVAVEVGGRVSRLDAGKAASMFGLVGSWLAPMSLPHKPQVTSDVEPQS